MTTRDCSEKAANRAEGLGVPQALPYQTETCEFFAKFPGIYVLLSILTVRLWSKENPPMLKGTRHTEAARLKQSLAAWGEHNPFFGRNHSPDSIMKFKRAAKRLWKSPTYRKRVVEGQRRTIVRNKSLKRSSL